MARQSIWNRKYLFVKKFDNLGYILKCLKIEYTILYTGVTQVSNCFAGSKLLINEDNPHIKAFRDM